MTRTTAKPSPRLVQLVREPSSWAYGLTPAKAEQVASWLQGRGFLDA
jgi:hypothetical protein